MAERRKLPAQIQKTRARNQRRIARRSVNTNTELANDPAPQLYDLETDLGETKNLAAAQPDRVKAMAARLATIRNR